MKKLEVKFSFILPIHNGELYLRECLDSLLNLDYDNYDIIVIINRCIDNTVKIVKEYMKYSKKILLYYSESSKVGMARNLGIRKSKCDYFICVDADDVINKNMLMSINKILNNKEYSLLRYNASTNHERKTLFCLDNKSREYSNLEYFNLVVDSYIKFGKISGPMWLYVINKKYFVNNKFKFINKLQEDYGIVFYLIYNAKSIYYLNEKLYFYRINNNGIMLKLDNQIQKIKDVIYFSEKYYVYFKNTSIILKLKAYITKMLIDKYKKLNKENQQILVELLKGSDLNALQIVFNNTNL